MSSGRSRTKVKEDMMLSKIIGIVGLAAPILILLFLFFIGSVMWALVSELLGDDDRPDLLEEGVCDARKT